MASFRYLWTNRVRPKFGSILFFKVWAKRIWCVPSLLIWNNRRTILKWRGANLANTAEIGRVKITGKKKHLTIGDFSFLGQVKIALHTQVNIGNNVCINDDVEILTGSHHVNDPKWSHKKHPIVIEDYCWISTGAIILPGVKLGRGSVIGARAVVSKSTEPYSILVGNPAQELNKKRIKNLEYNPCSFLPANQAWLVG